MSTSRMLSTIVVAFTLAACGGAPSSSATAATTRDTGVKRWEIDRAMRFHLAYVPSDSDDAGAPRGPDAAPAVGYAPRFAPDITNINLAEITALGFSLPKRTNPDAFKFYLKFFAFPPALDARKSTGGILDEFFLDRMARGHEIRDYAGEADHVFVKLGWVGPARETFSEAHPAPAFTLEGGATSQAAFDAHVPFSSLYVTPPGMSAAARDDDELARWSAGGVRAFYQEIVAAYRGALTPKAGPDATRFQYFEDRRCSAGVCRIAIFKIPQTPLVFDNWRDLPMPQDPNRIFLSGLLLVSRTEVACTAPCSDDVSVLLAQGKPVDAHILEVGSVVRLSHPLAPSPSK